MLHEKTADCTRRADRPLKNIRNFSSAHNSVNAIRIESNLWTYVQKKNVCKLYLNNIKQIKRTCNRALTISKGFVIIVVVKPPRPPATLCINRCDAVGGRIAISLSGK